MTRAAGFSWVALAMGLGALAGCKPPPTDADRARELPGEAAPPASAPLPSPDTDGAVWTISPIENRDRRIVYGVPGKPALVTLECTFTLGTAGPDLYIHRLSPADEGAGALLAIVGNGHIGRIAVDAREVDGRFVWEGYAMAHLPVWEPLAGPRKATVTVPGAGMVTLNPSPLPGALIEACASGEEFAPPPPSKAPDKTPDAKGSARP